MAAVGGPDGTEEEAGELPDEAKGVLGKLCVGRLVSLEGLTAALELNGQLAVCKLWDFKNQRWVVTMRETGKKKVVKVENLIPVQRERKNKHLVALEGTWMTKPAGYRVLRAFYGSERYPWQTSKGIDVTDEVIMALALPDSQKQVLADPVLVGGRAVMPVYEGPTALHAEFAPKERQKVKASVPKDANCSGHAGVRSKGSEGTEYETRQTSQTRQSYDDSDVDSWDEDDVRDLFPTVTLRADEGGSILLPKCKQVVRAWYGNPESPWNRRRGDDVTRAVLDILASDQVLIEASTRLVHGTTMAGSLGAKLVKSLSMEKDRKVLLVDVRESIFPEHQWTFKTMEVEGSIEGDGTPLVTVPGNWDSDASRLRAASAAECSDFSATSHPTPERSWEACD